MSETSAFLFFVTNATSIISLVFVNFGAYKQTLL